MTPATPDRDLRIASVNLQEGGIDSDTGSDARWHQTISVLAGWQPHVVLVQEMRPLAAAQLPPGCRHPRELTPTADCGAGRIDRFYTTPALVAAVRSYRQQPTGGSDHNAIQLTIDLAAAAAVIPREPVP